MGIYDSLRDSMRGTQLTNNSNWQAKEHQEQSSSSSLFDDIKDSIARSNEYGAPGHGYQGTFINGKMAVSREEAEGMASEEEYNDKIAEALGEGITRRGGNY